MSIKDIEYTQSGANWIALYKGKEIAETPIEKTLDEPVPKWFRSVTERYVVEMGAKPKRVVMARQKGWRNESVRHALARKGIKTGRKGKEIGRKATKTNDFEKEFAKTLLLNEEKRFLRAVAKRQREGTLEPNTVVISDVKKDLKLSDKEFNRIRISLEKRGEIYRPRHNVFRLTRRG